MAELDVNGSAHKQEKTSDDVPMDEAPLSPTDANGDEPPKKRRRTAKPNADKKYECKHEGCGKSYSRAEHLYRHQLNHTPKTIYRCDFPDCNRYFVRQDLCVRHRERHTTHGSQLHKRDTFAQASVGQSQPVQPPSGGQPQQDNTARQDYAMGAINDGYSHRDNPLESYTSAPYAQPPTFTSNTVSPSTTTTDPRFPPPTPQNTMNPPRQLLHRNSSTGSNPLSPEQKQALTQWQTRRDSIPPSQNRAGNTFIPSSTVPQSPVRTYSNSSASTVHFNNARTSMDYSMQNDARMNTYTQAPEMMTTTYHATDFRNSDMNRHSNDAFAAAVSHGLSTANTDPYLYSNMQTHNPAIDLNAAFGFPVFGGDDYNRSPFALTDDFTAWLFSDNAGLSANYSPDNMMGPFGDTMISQMQGPVLSQSPNSVTLAPASGSAKTMSVSSILDSSDRNSYIMSESKREELLDIMQNQFVERPHDAVKKRKDSIFEGNPNEEGHILSLRMMHTYIGSYWYHQHAQLPILHKPTFSADKTPALLLLAVLAIGAATLDKVYGTALTDSAAEFANFLAWHIRWEIIRDADFRPPAKLWVFQTLLLIEVYEKMYSTRALHERAHIHHDSTLTLMRRGSSLIGRSASDSPPSHNEEKNGKSIRASSAGAGANDATSKSEESWMRWITTEATRRAAFGAFVIDSIHCTMFGHSAKMVAHEMRLPLPCDEALWSATTPAEVGRVQATLQSNGIKPILFLESLKRTLNGQKVRTNSFGRTIVMAGLLSVSWHMTQRDLQIASIGPPSAGSFRGPEKWKSTLLRAFDNWKRDFDEALAESAAAPSSSPRVTTGQNTNSMHRPVDDENIFESRTVLHHLAHIAAHVDIVDCQVFAGANRLLSRSVTPRDYSLIREKIEKWATRASARDSAFYALKFITTVLVPPDANSDSIDSRIYGHASPILPQAYESNRYIARDDFLLNRPWILYISALVVWCYGYALEGAIKPAPKDEDFATYEQREQDMRDFLDRVAGVRAPDDLEHVQGKNRCLGLLLILQESFESTRWELTHEAAGLLGNAVAKLRGDEVGQVPLKREPKTWTAPPQAFQGMNGYGKHDPAMPKDIMIQRNIAASTFNTIRP